MGSVNAYFLIENTYLPLRDAPELEAKFLEEGERYDPYSHLYSFFGDPEARKVIDSRSLGMVTLCGRQWHAD